MENSEITEKISAIKIPNGEFAVEAIYTFQENEEFRGNPFIEALPPENYDTNYLIEKLAYYPKYADGERELDINYRMNCVSRLYRYFQPLDKHLLIENTFSQMLRSGYVCRNPIKSSHAEALQKGYLSVKTNQQFEYKIDKFNSVHGFSIIGVSGIGKTTAIEKVLSLYPQIIIHSNYKETLPSVYQLVYLKLDCPFDGSLKALCYSFFQEMDRLLGTNYTYLYGKSKFSTDNMMIHMAQLARLHGLGVLVLDELQHLSLANSGGAEKMLNFFVTLTNTLGVPVLLIGTMKSLSVLQQDFRQARRGAGQGNIIWERMQKDEMWNLLIEGMWKYQWTKNIIPFTEEIADVLYNESQGIVDIAIKLYAMAQYKAISSGSEKISAQSIRAVAKEGLSLIKPMIDALRSGKISEIAKFDDIRPFDITPFFNQKMNEAKFQQAIIENKQKEKENRSITTKSIEQEVIIKLIDLSIPPKKAQKLFNKAFKIVGNKASINDIVKTAIMLSMEKEESSNENSKIQIHDSLDLRKLYDSSISGYELLKGLNLITPISYKDGEVKIC